MLDSDMQEISVRCPVTKVDAYPTGGVFGVYAYHIPVPGGSNRLDYWTKEDVTPYLQNVSFKYDGSEALGWKDGNHYPYYWPLSGSMVFACYSPYISESHETITSVTYNDNLTSGRKENPHLVIGFTQAQDPSQMIDLQYFSTMSTSVDKTQGDVQILFSRALTKLSFYFSDPQSYYRISDVRLCNCIQKGVFYAAVDTPGWYPDLNNLTDYRLLTTAQQLTSSADNLDVPPLYLVPQPMNGEFPTLGSSTGKHVVLSFVLMDRDNDEFTYTMEVDLCGQNGNTLPAKWEKGTSYSYYINVEADPIEFDRPTVSIMVVDTPDTI